MSTIQPNDLLKAKIVYMIVNKKTEEAIEKLSEFYNIDPPEIVVGTIKGKRRTVYAVYVQKQSKIYTTNSDTFYNPFIILHEFYHHLRTKAGIHRGSEKHADRYANSYIDSFRKVTKLQNKDHEEKK